MAARFLFIDASRVVAAVVAIFIGQGGGGGQMEWKGVVIKKEKQEFGPCQI